MKIDGVPYRTIWLAEDGVSVEVIDQTLLPHRLEVRRLTTAREAGAAIATMVVRGAPLIGAAAAWGMALAAREDASDAALTRAGQMLTLSRPTAVNLRWAVERMLALLMPLPTWVRMAAAYAEADRVCDEDPLQRRLAGGGGLGHGLGPDLYGSRGRNSAACLGRRDPPAQPGRRPHRVGAEPSRRAAYGDRR
jgi:methylthioribose-1-phosphate isomerase